MGYIELETKNAIYRVEFGYHDKPVSNIVKSDAIVLETGMNDPVLITDLEGPPNSELVKFRQLIDVLKFAREQNIELFLPDAIPKQARDWTSRLKGTSKMALIPLVISGITFILTRKRNLSRRVFLSILLSFAGFFVTPPALNSLFVKKGKIRNELLKKYLTYFDRVWPTVMVELRTVLMAEKMEKFVALELRKKLRRKPLIYATFGVGHIGIIDALKDADYRQQVLESFYPLSEYFEKTNLYDCIRMIYDLKDRKWFKLREKGVLEERLPKKAVIERARKELQRLAEKEKREIEIKDTKPKIVEREKRFDRRELFRRFKLRV